MSDTEHEHLAQSLSGQYTIVRELGAGGMATVYLAHDLKHDRDVAIKVLKPELGAALGAARFLSEIRTTAKLQHPHILPLLDSGEAGGLLFYVMPLVQGESLRERLARESMLTVDETVRIMRQVAGALDYAHRQGVIHRDIKPENILLHDGEALLADFGIALAVAGAGGERLTGTGLSIGTPQYMSPEQATGERDLDARSDIYALGAVTYEMLAGEPPFSGANARATIAKLMTERPTSLRVVRDVVPAALDEAVMKALAKSPTDRFATARAFADALTGPSSVPDHAAPAPSSATTAAGARAGRNAPPWSRRPATLALIAVALVLVAALALMARRNDAADGGTPGAIRSIAVLPLDNYSGDSTQSYFAEGMTDELTADLASISQLRVTSRGSAMQFAGKNRPPTPVIAKTLNVDALVEGSVIRSGDRVRITAQLIDARADRHLWAKTFERSSGDVLALQAELAAAIAREINVQLTPREQSRLAAAPSVDPGAHDAYLKGRYFFNRPSDENLQKAIVQFEEAVRLTPAFAPAYSGLSDAYLWAGYNEGFITAAAAKPRARAAARKAVQLDSNSAEAHASLATFMLFYEYDWPACEREFRKAMALNPNYAFAPDQFGMALAFTGRDEEAIAMGKRAAALDPLSPQVLVDATMVHLFRKDLPAARELAKTAGELDPSFFFPVMMTGWIDLQVGRYRAAVAPIKRAQSMGAPPFVTAYLAYAYGASGDKLGALRELATLRALAKGAEVLPFNLALVYLGLGDRAKAIDYLERALAADSQMLAWIGRDAIFDSLRQEPRFMALIKRLNLTAPSPRP